MPDSALYLCPGQSNLHLNLQKSSQTCQFLALESSNQIVLDRQLKLVWLETPGPEVLNISPKLS
jgi:hypothetical protein